MGLDFHNGILCHFLGKMASKRGAKMGDEK